MMKYILILTGIILLFNNCKKEDQIAKPKACFNYSPDTDIETGDTIKFSNCSENATKFTWNFGDGTTSTDTLPTHVYKNSGSFIVKLETLYNNVKDTISKTILVKDKQFIMGEKEANGITTVFTPIDIEAGYSSSGKKIRFENIDVIEIDNYFTVNKITYEMHYYQNIQTLSNSLVGSSDGHISTYHKDDILKVTDNFSALYTPFPYIDSTYINGEFYIAVKFGDEKKYIGWIKLKAISQLHIFILDYCYYEV